VVERNDYYPFGGQHGNSSYPQLASNRFKYNGKELQTTGNTGFLDYGARMYDAVIGRFHTQDRFSEKYFPLSPYQYAANNPVSNIDVNGDSIWVSVFNTTTDENGTTSTTTTRYYYGQDANGNYGFLDASGNIYSGNDKFVGQLTTALGKLRQGGTAGAGLVNDLMTSTNNTEIVSRAANKADSQNGAYILWNPTGTNGGPDQNGGNTRPSFIGLGHEMAHIQDVWRGTINNNLWRTVTLRNGQTQNIPNAEIYATHIENQIRSENNVPLRVSYGINAAGCADPITRIIKAGTSQSIFYNQNGQTNYSQLKRKQTPFTY
jgi:RHS repeat-associated protein